MSNQEIIKKIEDLQTRAFNISMKDRLNNEDFERLREIDIEIFQLKDQLKEDES